MRRKSVQRQSFAARGENKKKVKKLKDIEPELIPEEIEEIMLFEELMKGLMRNKLAMA